MSQGVGETCCLPKTAWPPTLAGDDADSWKSVFEAEGYEVECLLRGLGENEAIRQIYVDHAKTALDSIK